MVTLRCTRRLLARLGVEPTTEEVSPTARLGDWHANLLYRPGGQVVLFMNDRTLLPVLVPASPGKTLTPRFKAALAGLLGRLGVDQWGIDVELAEAADVRIARTRSRVVLGMMNDFAFLLGAWREWTGDLTQESLRLADTPCSPIKMERPRDVAVELLRAGE